MKPNRLTRLLAAGAVSAIALTTAFAEDSTTTTTDQSNANSSSSSTTTSTSAPVEATGTITAKPESDFVLVQTPSSTAPIMYYYTKATTIVDANGKKMDWPALKADTQVKYTYVTEGERLVLQKLSVEKASSDKKDASAKH